MKSIKYIIYAVIGSLFLTNCEIETLKRDNPLDERKDMKKGIALKFYSYSVFSNYNVNQGERIVLSISLKNHGKNEAKRVWSLCSTTSAHVSDFYSQTTIWGDIPAGRTVWDDTWTIQFTVSNTVPAGTQIPINISMADDDGNEWSDSFNVPVE